MTIALPSIFPQSSVDECPCFHSDTDPDSEECSAIVSSSSSNSPTNPLLPCSFLPKVRNIYRVTKKNGKNLQLT